MLRPGLPALPVSSENEANLAALAELWFGGLGPLRTFLYLTGEIGVGGALVLDGELLRGAHGFAGEIGHVVVDSEGPLCRCGSRGCLEQYAGQSALLRAAGMRREPRVCPGVDELERRARGGDVRAVAAVEQAGAMLGRVLSGAVNLFDPDAVVLGGIYRELMPWLSPSADRELTAPRGLRAVAVRERAAARVLLRGRRGARRGGPGRTGGAGRPGGARTARDA